MTPRGGEAPKAGDFVSDVKELRHRARAHIEQGPITAGDKGQQQQEPGRNPQPGGGQGERSR